MCGIAGVVFEKPTEQLRQLFGLAKGLAHRGPDDLGFLIWDGKEAKRGRQLSEQPFRVGLVHRRLSILDLSEGGWQPMGTPDGRYFVVFNGEIYNFVELRAELEGIGQTFCTRSDTEVLLGAWKAWGPSSVRRFVGMFAFALLDTEENRLYLVRDPFGIKPLYYAPFSGGLVFASETPPLLEFPRVSRKIHPDRLYKYLRCGLTDFGGDTLLKGIKQLPPGHYLRVDLDGSNSAELVRYWEWNLRESLSISFGEAAQHLRILFLDSVRLHMRSDVPIGAALSGGIDSSSIVSVMRHLEPDLELHTFSFVAESEEVSEERYVDLVTQTAGAHIHKVRIRPSELVNDLDSLIKAQGEPFGSTSIYAQHRVFQLAREVGIKVMLDGQGADELLAGYINFDAARVVSLISSGQLSEALALLYRLSRLPGRKGVWKRVLARLLPPALQPIARNLAGESLVPRWLEGRWFVDRGVDPRSPSKLSGLRRERLRLELLEALTETSLPMLLRYEDRNSMAYSIESRVPFLTPNLAEFILGLPEGYILSPNGTSKAVFKEAMRGLVPDKILDRKDKIGFATPELEWFRSLAPWVEAQLKGDVLGSIPALRPDGILQEWREVLEGRRPFDFRVWRWINLIAWTRTFGVQYG
jgi:asparagine synthase (glutamine-hydrolysing)